MRSQLEDDLNGKSSVYVQHERVALSCSDPSRTRQEFAAECDINTLMSRFEKTGVVSHVNQRAPAYFDASEVPDLQGAIETQRAAEAAFMSLHANVRREFDNDPVRFIEFAANPDNLPRMREWGLARPAPAAEPEAASPAAAGPSPPSA